jgi:hypothetical protein
MGCCTTAARRFARIARRFARSAHFPLCILPATFARNHVTANLVEFKKNQIWLNSKKNKLG